MIQRQCTIADIMYIIGIFNFFQIMVLGMGYERCIRPLEYMRKIKYIKYEIFNNVMRNLSKGRYMKYTETVKCNIENRIQNMRYATQNKKSYSILYI